jgi:hypothetical protein
VAAASRLFSSGCAAPPAPASYTVGGRLAFSDAVPRTSREEHETNQRPASRRKVGTTAGRQLDGPVPIGVPGGGILQQRRSLHLAGRTRFPRPLSHPLLLPTRTRLASTETNVTLRPLLPMDRLRLFLRLVPRPMRHNAGTLLLITPKQFTPGERQLSAVYEGAAS